MSGIKRVFWDIETAPNIGFTWRTGNKLYIGPHMIIEERAIICICWKYEGLNKVHSLAWEDGDDKKMIEEFFAVIDDADELVAHNGDKFDMRWYNGRHLINSLPPVPQSKTVDTYKIAARHFALNSYTLDYLASILFGEHKIKTDFEWWRGVVRLTEPSDQERSKNLRRMVKYCKKDVKLLERVYHELMNYENASTHAAVHMSGDTNDRWKCPHCASDHVKKSKTRTTAKGTIQHQMNCFDCGRYYSVANNVFKLYLGSKERGN